jgi:hypothetical protein
LGETEKAMLRNEYDKWSLGGEIQGLLAGKDLREEGTGDPDEKIFNGCED